ncbi:SDR family oxidoreductase [Pigmentibacter ruber]|uniref:SDR family oxidoreductase n=1 Tax=Pigmentibacter ruber TaxID=2683196 RepID=UPI00192E350F|nr:SDR family oxidoreductase [Pigmentibacter ruber]BFD32280.1 SDR family oxidoreductase [Pigmentibacter ruber]
MEKSKFHQSYDGKPGKEKEMLPKPIFERPDKLSAKRLEGKIAIITGGDSGIGRATAIAFAKEGADLALLYLNEHEDALFTKKRVEEIGKRCLTLDGDCGNRFFCNEAIRQIIKKYGYIDILVNNCGEQRLHGNFEEISEVEIQKIFRTNIFSYFFMTQASLRFMKEGANIINCASVVAYKGSDDLIDYSATKGAVISFTRSLAKNLAKQKIRVNAVAPGPIWTPLIPSTFTEERLKHFGKDTFLERIGQPCEVAPSFVFLASEDASYMTGQVLHPNGGIPVNS